jgi:putative transposase
MITLLNPIFATLCYFCVTARELTREMIQVYLEHHFEPRADDEFEAEE